MTEGDALGRHVFSSSANLYPLPCSSPGVTKMDGLVCVVLTWVCVLGTGRRKDERWWPVITYNLRAKLPA